MSIEEESPHQKSERAD